MHKFVGGVQTPGVLVAKKKMFSFRNSPNGQGGGSVFYVTKEDHRYLRLVRMIHFWKRSNEYPLHSFMNMH